jgi:chromosome segregation ATPase
MERCDSLYGVSMEEKGISRMVSLQLNSAAG